MTAYATDTFNGDGSTVEFTIDFDYIQRDHVQVYRVETANNAETELTVIASGDPGADEYVWETDKRIRVGTAPTDEQQLKVQRDTPENQQLVQWRDGSYIIAKDLNDSDLQWLYGLQELEDKVGQLQSTAIKYLGAIDLTVDPAPAQPASGDFYINTGTGVVVDSWAGIAGDDVIGSEQVIYNGEEETWQIFVVPASQIGVVSVTGTEPISVNNDDPQRPVISFDGQLGVIVQDDAPTGAEEGWLWFSTKDNRLYVYSCNEADPPVCTWVDASPIGTAACSIGDSFPLAANSTPGDLFWHTEYSTLFVFYTDADSSQWVTASPTGAGGEGGASVEVGETPPDPTKAAAGDLFWSEETGRLYVFAQGAWIDASPDGEAPTPLWTRSGTTLRPAASGDDLDGIGSITAGGRITNGDDIATGNGNRLYPDGAVYIRSDQPSANTGSCFKYYNGGFNDASTKIKFGYNGSITAAGAVNAGDYIDSTDIAYANNEGTLLSPAGGIFIKKWDGSVTSADSVFGYYKSNDANNPLIRMGGDGSINAAGDIKSGGDPNNGAAAGAIAESGGLFAAARAPGLAVFAGHLVGTSKATSTITSDGDYYFAGSGITRGLTFELDPDNPANYVNTTNADGETESVYNGPTLDVKESIRNVQSALYRLKAAVLIPDTTVDQLRLRILEALETITEEVDS